MAKYQTEDIRTLALVGQGGCGKTTLAEALLYRAGAIASMGSTERGGTVCFVSHSAAAVERLCERTAVLYLGRVVEEGPTRLLLARPGHPYTVALRAAVPNIDLTAIRQAVTRPAEPPNAAAPPPGCPFHPRCPLAIDRCRTEPPAARAKEPVRAG